MPLYNLSESVVADVRELAATGQLPRGALQAWEEGGDAGLIEVAIRGYVARQGALRRDRARVAAGKPAGRVYVSRTPQPRSEDTGERLALAPPPKLVADWR